MSPPDRRRLSDDDIEAIIVAIEKRQEHVCRYNVTPDQLQSVVRFVGHIDSLLSETGSTIRKTIIVAGISGFIALLGIGAYAKIKQIIGGP